MQVFQIELLNVEGLGILQELVRLKVIRMAPADAPYPAFANIVSNLRNRAGALPPISLEEISQEVESVRTQQYKDKNAPG